MDQASLRSVLATVLTPNTNKVKEATATLKRDYYGSPQSLLLLLQILVSDDTADVRQLATTEARKLVPKHWPNLQDAQKQEIRTQLLKTTTAEKNKLLRHSMSRLIAVIAQLDKGKWAQLPQLLLQGAQNSNPQAREVSTFILLSILDELDDDEATFDDAQLIHVFSKTIQDKQNPEVAMNTLCALSKVAVSIDTDDKDSAFALFQEVVPSMFQALLDVANAGDEDQTARGFDAFQTILESKPKVLDSNFKEIVLQMAQLAGDTTKDNKPRSQAVNFLMSAILNRKLKFQSLKIGPQLVDLVFKVLSGEDDDQFDQDEDDELGLYKASMHLLMIMSDQLPPPQVAAPVVTLFKEYAVSPDTRKKQASISALANIVDGSPDYLSTQLPDLVQLILNLLNDPIDSVRESAILGIRDIADEMPECLAPRHEEFLTAFIKNLAAAVQPPDTPQTPKNQNVAANCCLAIDGLVRGLDAKKVEEFMPQLVPNLVHFFDHDDIEVQKASISAVGSIASVALEGFLPYLQVTAASLITFIGLKDSEDELDLRSISVDNLGTIAEAVGPDAFRQFVPYVIESSQEGLNLDHPRLKETSFMLWSSLAKTYKEQFKEFLEPAVKAILESLAQEDDAELDLEFDDDDTDLPTQLLIGNKKVTISNGDLNGEDSDDSEAGWDDIAALSGVAEEKEVALECLGDIFTNLGAAFGPIYLKETLNAILPLLEHSWDPLRSAAIGTLFRLYTSIWKLQPEEKSKWEPGLPIQIQPLGDVVKMRDLIITYVAKQYPTEDDPDCLMAINASLSATLDATGPYLISDPGTLKGIVECLISIIGGQHPCQVSYEDEEEELKEDYSEIDFAVISSAMETIGSLASVLGPQFGEVYKMFEKLLLGHASSSSRTARTHTTGILADIIRKIKAGISPYTSKLMKVFLHRLVDEDNECKTNAMYGTGLLCLFSTDEAVVLKSFDEIMTKLGEYIHSDDRRLMDNAIGCVSRMINKHPSAIPIPSILPILVDLLPLEEDLEENIAVWAMIGALYLDGNPTVQQLTPKILPVLEQVIREPDHIDQQTREFLYLVIQHLNGKIPGLVHNYPGLTVAL